MSLELNINGRRIDLLPGTSIPVTYVANDLAELQNRQSNFSRRFSIPFTQNNRDILELSEQINSTTDFPYAQHRATLIQDGIQLIPDGVFELSQSRSNYSGQIVSGTVDFFDAIKAKNVRDIDLNEFNHIWDVQSAVNSVDNTEGFIYAQINFSPPETGVFDPQGPPVSFFIEFMPASVFFHTVIERIISEAGFTLLGLNVASDFLNRVCDGNGAFTFDMDMYRNMIIPFSNDELPNPFGGFTVVSTLLPDINQADLIKAFMQMFGLFPDVDNLAKTIRFYQLKDVVKNKDKAENWTEKMDMKTPPIIQYNIKGYAQVNNLLYTKDELEEDLGIGSIDIDDTTVTGEKTLVAPLFAPTIGGENYSLPHIVKISGGEFNVSTKPRVLVLRRQGGGNPFPGENPANFYAGPGVNPDFTLVPNGHLARCHFQFTDPFGNSQICGLQFGDIGGEPNGLITNHYNEFDSMFNRIKRIIINANLNQTDITKLDHSIPIYLRQFSEFFYLNKISNYITGRFSAVELIRL